MAGEGEILSLGEYADFLFYFFLHSFLLNKLPGFLKMYKEALHPIIFFREEDRLRHGRSVDL